MVKSAMGWLIVTVCWISAVPAQEPESDKRTSPPAVPETDSVTAPDTGAVLTAPKVPAPENVTIVDQALAKAKSLRKYLIIAVYDDDCEECDQYEANTFVDPKVTEWLEQHAELLRLRLSEPVGRNFAEAHAIGGFPTVLFLSDDGRELGRRFGYLNPMRFLAKANRVFQFSKSMRSRGSTTWRGEDQILATMAHAATLTAEGKHEQAFEQYLWCIEHRASHSPVFQVKHLGKLIDGFAELAKAYQPAEKELEAWLSRARRSTLGRDARDTYSFYAIRHICRVLGREEEILAHYDRLKKKWGQTTAVDSFAVLLYDPLLKARRYDELVYSVDTPEHVNVFLEQARKGRYDREYVRKNLTERYEVLMGVGQFPDARDVATKLERFDPSARTYFLLAKAGLRSKRPNDDNIVQARKAVEKTKLKDAEAVILFAKLLTAKRLKYPEAINTLRNALQAAESQDDRAALQACLDDVKAGKQWDVKWSGRRRNP
ncbi:MAG: thioredoxin family protein [Planctomycetes bacterium]|nr:thioredoxin family protein [Planctomycetota bacterium]